MTIEEARKIGISCATELYPPINPIVLARAIAELYMSHVPGDKILAIETTRWLASLTLKD